MPELMEYIVLGKVKPEASRRARVAALSRYLKRDPAASGVVTTREMWASHPDYFMVLSLSAETEAAVWTELSPWSDVCKFKVVPVQPMRGFVEQHLTEARLPAEDTPADAAPPPLHSEAAPVDPPNPLAAALQALLESDTHDAPWPEDNYTGSDLAVYNDILTQLDGVAPKSGTLSYTAMEKVHKPSGVPDQLWNPVYNHLVDELGYFQKVDNWFGDKGHLEELSQHMLQANQETIFELSQQTTMLQSIGLGAAQPITMSFAEVIEVFGVLIPLVETDAVAVGILLELAGSFLSKTDGGSPFTALFGTLSVTLEAQYESFTTLIERSHSRLRTNWGRLQMFGFLVETGQVKWPSDTSAVRAAAARSFETYLWQVILPKLTALYHWMDVSYSPVPVSITMDPNANQYLFATNAPASYPSGGCHSQPIQGYQNVVHQFAGAWFPVDDPYNPKVVPLPADFLYRLFGTDPRPGIPNPLSIPPLQFFAAPVNPNNPWSYIQTLYV